MKDFHIAVAVILNNWNSKSLKTSDIKFQNFEDTIWFSETFFFTAWQKTFFKNFQESAAILHGSISPLDSDVAYVTRG